MGKGGGSRLGLHKTAEPRSLRTHHLSGQGKCAQRGGTTEDYRVAEDRLGIAEGFAVRFHGGWKWRVEWTMRGKISETKGEAVMRRARKAASAAVQAHLKAGREVYGRRAGKPVVISPKAIRRVIRPPPDTVGA